MLSASFVNYFLTLFFSDTCPAQPSTHPFPFPLVLSHLVCASLQEDTYGTVQRDIPKILEAFTSFLIAIEEYQVELNGLLKPLPTDREALAKMSAKERYERNALEVEVWRAGEVLGFVGDGEDHFSYSLFSARADGTYLRLAGLKEAIARIVRNDE